MSNEFTFSGADLQIDHIAGHAVANSMMDLQSMPQISQATSVDSGQALASQSIGGAGQDAGVSRA